MSDPTFGALCALASALAWSVTSLLARSLIPHYGSVTINAVRSGAAGALLLVVVMVIDGPGTLTAMSRATFVQLTVSIVAAIGIGDTVFFESTRAIGLSRAMTIATTYPVGAALLAAAFLDEPLTLPVIVGSLLTLGGIALIVSVRSDAAHPERLAFGVWTAVVASVAWAVSTVMMKLPLTEIEPLTAQAVRLPLASVLLWLTPWTWGAAGAMRKAGRGPLVTIGMLSIVTAPARSCSWRASSTRAWRSDRSCPPPRRCSRSRSACCSWASASPSSPWSACCSRWPASSCSSCNRRTRKRADQPARKTTSPPTSVSMGRISAIRSSEQVNTSSESTIRSARLPGSSVPSSAS